MLLFGCVLIVECRSSFLDCWLLVGVGCLRCCLLFVVCSFVCLFVASWLGFVFVLLFVVGYCPLSVLIGCCLLSHVSRLLFLRVACCSLIVVVGCSLCVFVLFVVCCLMLVCWLLILCWWLFVICCLLLCVAFALFVVRCSLLVCCLLRVVCVVFVVVRCSLIVACCWSLSVSRCLF